MLKSALLAFALANQSSAGLYLFRRNRRDDVRRHAALDELFEALRAIFATTALLKPDWVEQWDQRTRIELPPKYRSDQFLYPRAVDAAFDAKFARALLYRNRWRSRIEPLFESFDADSWSRVRATIERSSTALLAVRDAHVDAFREDEASWIDRAVENLDEARYMLRAAERQHIPAHELIATTTFQTLYTALQLSETMLDGLRREAIEER
jgi:hypothetical protein